ncbi:MAG: hypothetical protein K1V76_04870 [Candidatus Amulumruptor sp.]
MSLPTPKIRLPLWVGILLLVLILPAFMFPAMLQSSMASGEDTVKTLVMLYPVAVILYGIVSWLCYVKERMLLFWILVAMMALTDIMMFVICPIY